MRGKRSGSGPSSAGKPSPWRSQAGLALIVAAVVAASLVLVGCGDDGADGQAAAEWAQPLSRFGQQAAQEQTRSQAQSRQAQQTAAQSPHHAVQVSAGDGFACAVTTDGAVECWGDNELGQTVAPAERFSQVSAGGDHTCAVTTDGAVECWGWNDDGESNAPLGQFNHVSAGGDHTCALTSGGELECWGNNGRGQTDAPTGRFSQVSAYNDFSCGLRPDGGVVCWGASDYEVWMPVWDQTDA